MAVTIISWIIGVPLFLILVSAFLGTGGRPSATSRSVGAPIGERCFSGHWHFRERDASACNLAWYNKRCAERGEPQLAPPSC